MKNGESATAGKRQPRNGKKWAKTRTHTHIHTALKSCKMKRRNHRKRDGDRHRSSAEQYSPPLAPLGASAVR